MKKHPTRATDETRRSEESAVTQHSGLQVKRSSIWANVVSSLLLRVASRTSFVLLGFYLGERFASTTLVVLVIEAFYLTELTLAPIAGSLSDRWGRKPFLLLAPFLGALAALFLLGGSLLSHPTHHAAFNPRLAVFLLLILCGRLLEGATTAFNTPACLGYITDTTAHAPYLRARVMTAFEVVTVGGIALAIPFGGQVSTWLGIWGFLVVVGLHAVNLALVALAVQEHGPHVLHTARRTSLLESFKMLREKHVFTFLPAWLSISSLVGSWTTLAVIILAYPNPAADRRFPRQLFYGGFAKSQATLLVGGIALCFLLGMGLWVPLLSRLRRTTIMLIGLAGLTLCVVILSIDNGLAQNPASLSAGAHTTILASLPLLILGIVLLSGFTPAALTHMATIAELHAGKRGAVMGLYSIVLGLGQWLGAAVGAVSVDLDGFYGLMVFSCILGLCSLLSVCYMRNHGHDLLQSKPIESPHL